MALLTAVEIPMVIPPSPARQRDEAEHHDSDPEPPHTSSLLACFALHSGQTTFLSINPLPTLARASGSS